MKKIIVIILISLLATIIFGIIDGLSFLFIENELTKFWNKFGIFNDQTIPIMNGGISSSIAIFISSFVHSFLKYNFNILEHPLLDSIGIIIGTIIVIAFFSYFLKSKLKNKN